MIRNLMIAGFCLFSALGTGCSAAGDPNPPMLAAGDPMMMATPGAPEACANHEEGCPCDIPGETTDCGRIKRVAGDYVWCSTGTQTCDQYGSWGKCTGDQVAATPAQ
jgi:hypothetical protein